MFDMQPQREPGQSRTRFTQAFVMRQCLLDNVVDLLRLISPKLTRRSVSPNPNSRARRGFLFSVCDSRFQPSMWFCTSLLPPQAASCTLSLHALQSGWQVFAATRRKLFHEG